MAAYATVLSSVGKDLRCWKPGHLYATNRGDIYTKERDGRFRPVEKDRVTYAGKHVYRVKYIVPGTQTRASAYVHEIVAELFCRKAKNSSKVYTRDGNYLNCQQSNLYWNGCKENNFLLREAFLKAQEAEKDVEEKDANTKSKISPMPVPIADVKARQMSEHPSEKDAEKVQATSAMETEDNASVEVKAKDGDYPVECPAESDITADFRKYAMRVFERIMAQYEEHKGERVAKAFSTRPVALEDGEVWVSTSKLLRSLETSYGRLNRAVNYLVFTRMMDCRVVYGTMVFKPIPRTLETLPEGFVPVKGEDPGFANLYIDRTGTVYEKAQDCFRKRNLHAFLPQGFRIEKPDKTARGVRTLLAYAFLNPEGKKIKRVTMKNSNRFDFRLENLIVTFAEDVTKKAEKGGHAEAVPGIPAKDTAENSAPVQAEKTMDPESVPSGSAQKDAAPTAKDLVMVNASLTARASGPAIPSSVLSDVIPYENIEYDISRHGKRYGMEEGKDYIKTDGGYLLTLESVLWLMFVMERLEDVRACADILRSIMVRDTSSAREKTSAAIAMANSLTTLLTQIQEDVE